MIYLRNNLKQGLRMSQEVMEKEPVEQVAEEVSEKPTLESSDLERVYVPKKPLPDGYRTHFDKVISNMFSNPRYIDYNFYAHVLAQCKINFDVNMKAAAAVSFSINHFKLWINPEMFDKFSLDESIGVLKHEMLHILNNHCTVRTYDTENQYVWNIAFDCAINQLIKREHLPKQCIFPETIKAPEKYSGEQYYDFLRNQAMDQLQQKCETCQGSGHSHEDCESCGGTGENPDGSKCEDCDGSGKKPCEDCGGTGGGLQPIDDHGKWKESEGNDELRKDITKHMIEKAISKTRGNLPHNIDEMLEMFSRTSQVSWKRELRNIVGNKKANRRPTMKRPDRRFPERVDIKGVTKDTIMELLVLCDVSGSMSDEDILKGLSEIHHVCKLTNTSMKMIQIDTEIHAIEEFNKNTKIFKRSGAGGTYLEPALDYVRERNVPHNAIIIITDSYHEDISSWKVPPKCKVMFLVSGDGKVPGIEAYPRYKQFNLKDA